MKKILLIALFALLGDLTISAQEIKWLGLEEAIALQKKTPKKIMIDVYTNWCGPCKMLDRNTFQKVDVANYINQHYYAVKLNGEGNDEITYNGVKFTNPDYNPDLANKRNSPHELANHFKIRAYPTIIFLDENAQLIFPLAGYKTPSQLELYLKMLKDDQHKAIDSQQKFDAYYKAFKPVFKD